MTKRSPWQAKDAEIAALRAEIERLRVHPMLKQFWLKVGANVTLCMATMEQKEWPDICKASFENAAYHMPVAGQYAKAGMKERGLW